MIVDNCRDVQALIHICSGTFHDVIEQCMALLLGFTLADIEDTDLDVVVESANAVLGKCAFVVFLSDERLEVPNILEIS